MTGVVVVGGVVVRGRLLLAKGDPELGRLVVWPPSNNGDGRRGSRRHSR